MADEPNHNKAPIKRRVVIDSPNYQGEDRRGGTIKITHCDCHMKHTSKIGDHEKSIGKIQNGITKLKDDMYQRMDIAHESMRSDIKQKVNNRLFYIFISVYSAFFIGGVVTLYMSLNDMNVSLMTNITETKEELKDKMSILDTEVRVLNVTMDNHIVVGNRIEKKIEQVDKKVEDHIHQTNNGNSQHGRD